MANLVMQDQ